MKIDRRAKTPAKHDLFYVDNKSEILSKEKAEVFHHIVAKLLYVSKRARMDIDLAVAFLCTRVAKNTEEDWLKLKRLLNYIRRTIEMRRTIGVDSLNHLRALTDASYAVHDDARGTQAE